MFLPQKKFLLSFMVIILAVGGIFAWQNYSGNSLTVQTISPSPEASTPLPTLSATPQLSLEDSEVKEFTITARQFVFEPNIIRVKVGDRVRLTLHNIDVEHGISIPAFNVNIEPPVGVSQSTEFVADRAGTFNFSCSVFCGSGHRGMGGMFIVE